MSQQNSGLDIAGLVQTHQSKLKSFIRSKVGSAEDAEDITQEVFCQLAKLDTIVHPIDNISGWLYAVARNKITDRWRKTGGVSEVSADDISEALFAESESAEDEYIKDMLWADLEEALSELPPEQRDAFELTEVYGMSFKEIAEATGVNTNTLLSRKRYAVLYLRQRLRDYL